MYKIFFLLLIFYSLTYAQVNTEKYRNIDEEYSLSGLVEINYSMETGNVDYNELELESGINWNTPNFYSFLIGLGDYKWQAGKQFSNEALFHLRFVKRLSENFEVETFTQYDHNRSRSLFFRALVGAGIRFNILKSESSELWIGSAYMFERQNVEITKPVVFEEWSNFHRWSNYITFDLRIKEGVDFITVNYYQPSFENFNDYQFLSENNIIFGISGGFSFIAKFKMRFDNIPPDDTIKKLDTKTDLGFIIRF